MTRWMAAGGAIVLALTLLLGGGTAVAREEINTDDEGVAVHGYDVVAYFEPGVAVKGEARHAARHDGVVYLFRSTENRERFLAAPQSYLPAYGGFCSYGVRVGRKFDVDPTAWRVVEGKLYLQLDQGTQVIWLSKMQENITIADRLWPLISSLPDEELAERSQ